jgi:cytochrome bd-type quinol oxidase subunit 2
MKRTSVRPIRFLFGFLTVCLPLTFSHARLVAQTIEPLPIAKLLTANIESEGIAIGVIQLPNWSEMTEIAMLLAVFLLGYSLLTAGRRGWGWATIVALATLLLAIGRIFLSMFLEVTTDYGPPDWDEE